MSPFRRSLIKWARTVHLYATLSTLGLLLLFAITGFMLNHEDWFVSGEPVTRTVTGSLPTGLLEGPDKLAIVELLRKDFGAVGLVDSFEEEGDAFQIVFKRPGTRVEVTVTREDGETSARTELRGLAGILLDLHRGKATGLAWSLVIDGVCLVMIVLATTGMILFSSLQSRGRYGLAVLAVGLAAAGGIVMLYFG